jgi:hypothetical protein
VHSDDDADAQDQETDGEEEYVSGCVLHQGGQRDPRLVAARGSTRSFVATEGSFVATEDTCLDATHRLRVHAGHFVQLRERKGNHVV